jgi:glycosyltransferase involved in cell wall biosynthesis
LLETASYLPKTCGVVTRLHRYEMYRWVDKINWNFVDRIILVSEAKKREFGGHFPDQAHKIVVIPEAISLERFESKPKTFVGDLGILCNLSPRKRVYELILAFYELSQQREDFHLHIGGSKHPGFPDYEDALHTLVDHLGLQNKVTFYGNVQEPQDWFRKIDIFISNSYSEGLQVSPMEAIASGCYCLSHHWDGAEELFPQANLFFTGQEMIRKILNYANLDHSARLEKIAELQTIVRQNYDINKTKIQIRNLVEEVAASYASGTNAAGDRNGRSR